MLLVCMLLGALTAIGVAWRIARSGPAFDQSRSPPRWSHATGAAWLYQSEESSGALRLRGRFASADAAGNRRAVVAEPAPSWSLLSQQALPEDQATIVWEEAFGWPVPAMSVRLIDTGGGMRVVGGIDLGPDPKDWSKRRFLPTRTIWSGIVIDALAFAPMWWIALGLLLLAHRLLWRWPARRRSKRGRCPRCGYDLRGKLDEGCSECGWRRDTLDRPVQGAA